MPGMRRLGPTATPGRISPPADSCRTRRRRRRHPRRHRHLHGLRAKRLGNSRQSRRLALADDLDDDGDLDAYVADADAGRIRVWLNDGTGDLHRLAARPSAAATAYDRGAWVTCDGDGDLDAFVANYAAAISVCAQRRAPAPSPTPARASAARSTYGVGARRPRRRRRPRRLHRQLRAANQVWLNNGAGTFTDSGQTLGSDATATAWRSGTSTATATSTPSSPTTDRAANRVWLNDGHRHLHRLRPNASVSNGQLRRGTGRPRRRRRPRRLRRQRYGQANRVWLNDGPAPSPTPARPSAPTTARGGTGRPRRRRRPRRLRRQRRRQRQPVWLNDGAGTFTDSGQTLGAPAAGAALGDLDGDGDLDAYVANYGRRPTRCGSTGRRINGRWLERR